jgi:retron-type reverse transcriptase
MKYICYTSMGYGKNSTVAYVCSNKTKLPNGKCCDWGYTSDVNSALRMSEHLKNTYVSDAKFCSRACAVLKVED